MNLSILKPETIINEVFALYEKNEPELNLEHVSQAAALAEEEGFEDEVVLAAFFHNIGHLCTKDTERNNRFDSDSIDQERLGADFLRERGFSERVASLVESNVIAQRYLSYKYPEYYDHLSDTDKLTLESHGGRMSQKEAANFELNPDADVFLRLRYWDDKAKQVNRQLPDIRHIKLLMMSHLYKNN